MNPNSISIHKEKVAFANFTENTCRQQISELATLYKTLFSESEIVVMDDPKTVRLNFSAPTINSKSLREFFGNFGTIKKVEVISSAKPDLKKFAEVSFAKKDSTKKVWDYFFVKKGEKYTKSTKKAMYMTQNASKLLNTSNRFFHEKNPKKALKPSEESPTNILGLSTFKNQGKKCKRKNLKCFAYKPKKMKETFQGYKKPTKTSMRQSRRKPSANRAFKKNFCQNRWDRSPKNTKKFSKAFLCVLKPKQILAISRNHPSENIEQHRITID